MEVRSSSSAEVGYVARGEVLDLLRVVALRIDLHQTLFGCHLKATV